MENSWIDSWVRSLPEKTVEYDTPLHSDATQKPKIAPRKRKIASGSLPEARKHDNPLPSDATRKLKRKNKIASSSCLASPPSSSMSAGSNSMASTPKKRRLESVDAPVDLEATPRPALRNFPSSSSSISLSRSLSRSLSTSRSRAGSASRSSSPKKQMMSLSLNDAVVYDQLVKDTVPVAAKKLYKTLENFAEMKNILPHGFKQAITEQQAIIQRRTTTPQQVITQQRRIDQIKKYQNLIEEYEELKDSCGPESAPDDNLPGRIPSLDEIDQLVRKAIRISTRGDNEATWNARVHVKLLDMIFEDPLMGQCSEFNTADITTAQLHKEFIRSVASTAKMVDICIHASFEYDEEWISAIKRFGLVNPTQTVNYTDYQPIQYDPIILSIETKKLDEQLKNAKLQIGIWHAAHWSFLEWAVGEKLLQQLIAQGLDEPSTAQEQEEFEKKKIAALSSLSFIPGIIISGNRWQVVLSTYDKTKKTTVLCTDTAFGTTRTIKGAYAAVAGVRELTAWGRDVYLPWFKEHVLIFD